MHSVLATAKQDVMPVSHCGFNTTEINMSEQLSVQLYTYMIYQCLSEISNINLTHRKEFRASCQDC